MGKELLHGLTRADVKKTLKPVEPQESYAENIAQKLEKTVYGQPEACRAIARRLALFDSGLSDPNRPLGSVMELGPTGVGKTEMAHAAAKQMFGDANSSRLKIINMAEMTERHYITRFVGSPPSYVGNNEKSLIPHDWLHAGRSIIVLDEFEKAHPAIHQLFLGALDKGYMEARDGYFGTKQLNFKNTLFIFTSNISGMEISKITNEQPLGFGKSDKKEQNKEISIAAERGLRQTLSPEFINRLDDVVVFKEIKDRNIHNKILTKFIDERNDYLKNALGELAPYFAVTQEFRDHILDSAGDKGGRAIKRQLEKELFTKASDVLMGVNVHGKPLVADYEDGVVFYTDDSPPIEEAPPPPPEPVKKKVITKDDKTIEPENNGKRVILDLTVEIAVEDSDKCSYIDAKVPVWIK